MRDIYSKDSPGVADPANNLVPLFEGEDLLVGVKALRIVNESDSWTYPEVVTMLGETIEIPIPPNCVWIEPLRITRIENDDGCNFAGYTEQARPEPS